MIVVEHDLSVLDYLSDFICCLYGKPGAYGELLRVQGFMRVFVSVLPCCDIAVPGLLGTSSYPALSCGLALDVCSRRLFLLACCCCCFDGLDLLGKGLLQLASVTMVFRAPTCSISYCFHYFCASPPNTDLPTRM